MTESATPVTTAPAPERGQGLNRTLTNSIWLMVLVTAVSVILTLFVSFEGKVPRIAGTFLVFGIFTVFAALDAREEGPELRGPIAQVGNSYMLSLTLVYMWGSLMVRDFNGTWLIPQSLLIMLLVRAGIFVVQRVSDLIASPLRALSRWAKAAATGLAASTVLLTAPIGADFFHVFGDPYWRVCYAVLAATGLAVASTSLLYFVNRRQERLSAPPAPKPPAPTPPASRVPRYNDRQPDTAMPFANPGERRPVPAAPPAPQPAAAPQPAPAAQAPRPPRQYAPPALELMTWPLMPDGRTPVPKLPNGRPDWNALHHIVWIHANAENQWLPSVPTR